MAGMLPGVECARRRRFHRASVDSPAAATRKSSFCLYTSKQHHTSMISYSLERNMLNEDEKLEGVAREAKERLDERLRTHKFFDTKRQGKNNGERSEVCGSKKRNGFTIWRKFK